MQIDINREKVSSYFKLNSLYSADLYGYLDLCL